MLVGVALVLGLQPRAVRRSAAHRPGLRARLGRVPRARRRLRADGRDRAARRARRGVRRRDEPRAALPLELGAAAAPRRPARRGLRSSTRGEEREALDVATLTTPGGVGAARARGRARAARRGARRAAAG